MEEFELTHNLCSAFSGHPTSLSDTTVVGSCAFFIWLLVINHRTRWWCLKCVIVYLVRVIPAFVMYCVNGASRSSLLIKSTDSMIVHCLKTIAGMTFMNSWVDGYIAIGNTCNLGG